MDETYIKIKGKFIKNLLETCGIPEKITTDRAPSIISAIKELKNIRKYERIEHRTIKYLNNII